MSFTPVRSTVPINQNFSPVPQTGSGIGFRDVLASNQTNNIYTALTSGKQRDQIIDAIQQARALIPPTFTAPSMQRSSEAFSIRNYYTMTPEEIKPKLKQLENDILSSDLSGMTSLEKLEWLEDKYKETFGDDFMMGFNLLHCVPGHDVYNKPGITIGNFEYVEIGLSFQSMFLNMIGQDGLKANRERLYGDMNDMEVMDALMKKYPQPLTNKDLALINAEIKAIGMSDDIGFFRYVESLIKNSNELPWDDNFPGWHDFEERWNSLLNNRADVQHLAYLHNANISDSRPNPHAQTWITQTTNILVKLGAILGPDGLFLQSKERIFLDYNPEFTTNDSDDLFDGFLKDLEKHEKTLRESRELLEKNRDMKKVSGVYEATVDNYYSNITSTADYSQ